MSLIYDKNMQLFSDSEMIQRKMTTQEEFERSFQLYAECTVEAIEHAFEDLSVLCRNTKPNFQNRNFKANNLNSYVQGYLSECSNFLAEIKDGRFSVSINGHRLFPKKVSKHLLPSNIPTKAVRMYNNQESHNELDTDPVTYIGYVVDDTWSALTGVYAIHMENNTIAWVSDLASLAFNQKQITTNQADDDIIVTLKKKGAEKAV